MILECITELLNSLNPNQKDVSRSGKAMESLAVHNLDIDDFLYWHEDYFTRNLISKTEAYEVYLCCWEKGQFSKTHDLSGQDAWIKVIEGGLSYAAFNEVNQIESQTYLSGDLITIHDPSVMYTLKNACHGRTISLHLVSYPISFFQVQKGKGSDVELIKKKFHTINGTLLTPNT